VAFSPSPSQPGTLAIHTGISPATSALWPVPLFRLNNLTTTNVLVSKTLHSSVTCVLASRVFLFLESSWLFSYTSVSWYWCPRAATVFSFQLAPPHGTIWYFLPPSRPTRSKARPVLAESLSHGIPFPLFFFSHSFYLTNLSAVGHPPPPCLLLSILPLGLVGPVKHRCFGEIPLFPLQAVFFLEPLFPPSTKIPA